MKETEAIYVTMLNYSMKLMLSIKFGIVGSIILTIAQAFYDFAFPVRKFLLFTFILVLTDSITGVWAATKRKEKIHSYGFRRTFRKIMVYFIVILLSEGMTHVFLPGVPISFTVAIAIAITEFKSNIENAEDITGIEIWKTIKEKINIK